MNEYLEYNPLDYENLTKNCVLELMQRGPFTLPLSRRFEGAGVYALFYTGDFGPYAQLKSLDATRPIYVGKAEPPGRRKGMTGQRAQSNRALYSRITQHVRSIASVENLKVESFLCRYLVVTPLWITMAERFLIEHYRPIWNLCLDGFGIHNPGKGRWEGEIPWWDALHPGRTFAANLRQTRSQEQAVAHLEECLQHLSRLSDKEVIQLALEEDETEEE